MVTAQPLGYRAGMATTARTRIRTALGAALAVSWLVLLSCIDATQGRRALPGVIDTIAPEDTAEPDVADDTTLPPPTTEWCGQERLDIAGLQDVAVLLVMDRSRSMSLDGKWAQTRAAVSVALDAYDEHLRFGLLLYPEVAAECPVAAVPQVDFAYQTGPAIADAMSDAGTAAGTPTGSALRAARQVLSERAGDADQRVVILATDGRPSCPTDCSVCVGPAVGGCSDGDCESCFDEDDCAIAESLAGVDQLAADGVPTYVVGIVGSYGIASVLQELALRGGTALGEAGYYETNDGGDVAEALVDIAVGVDGCSATLEAPPTLGPSGGELLGMVVTVNGVTVPRDPEGLNGWRLDAEGTRLRLYGPACLGGVGDETEVVVSYRCAVPAESRTPRTPLP